MKIRGVEWKIIRRRLKGSQIGCASRRNDGSGTITLLPKKLYPEPWIEIDTLIHEVIHAALWDIAEEAVGETASCIAQALRESGLVAPTAPPSPKRSRGKSRTSSKPGS